MDRLYGLTFGSVFVVDGSALAVDGQEGAQRFLRVHIDVQPLIHVSGGLGLGVGGHRLEGTP